MEVSEDFTITLRLGQQPLSITIRREDEEAYRAAEKLINQKYNSYAAQYPDQGNEIYLCMADNKNIHSTGKTTRTVSLSPRHADGVSGA